MTTAPKGPSPNLPATNRFALDRTRRRQRSVRSPQVAIPPTPAPTWQLGVHRQHHGRRAPPIRHHPAPPFGAQILPPLTIVTFVVGFSVGLLVGRSEGKNEERKTRQIEEWYRTHPTLEVEDFHGGFPFVRQSNSPPPESQDD